MKPPFPCLGDVWEKNELVEESNGWIRLVSPRPGVLYDRVEGTLGDSMYPRIIALSEEILETSERLVIFNDWEGSTEYVPAARNELTKWAHSRRARIDWIHFVTRSTKVTLGVVLAGSVLRFVRYHKNRERFEQALIEALATR